jgi:hypothetical protein
MVGIIATPAGVTEFPLFNMESALTLPCTSQYIKAGVALWFYMYILVSDHNATDPVMQNSCNLRLTEIAQNKEKIIIWDSGLTVQFSMQFNVLK